MSIRIRDWNEHFEQDRSKQWKHIKWVPIPNKQGQGYRKIMSEKNGLEIFACWIALVQAGSLCETRGDLSKYSINDLSLLTLINEKLLKTAIDYLSQVLDWIEVIENLDISVKKVQKNVIDTASGSSIQFNSIQCNSLKDKNIIPPNTEMVSKYCLERKNNIDPQSFIDHYEARGWQFKTGQKMKDWQAAVRTWEKNNFNKQPPQPQKQKLVC